MQAYICVCSVTLHFGAGTRCVASPVWPHTTAPPCLPPPPPALCTGFHPHSDGIVLHSHKMITDNMERTQK
ncbi:hypothetical protein B5X24_HaOG205020 [Helicoverpa armigera]|nr:hypothetical protein B5X24_HaOG205020 [Helicoverpa armigera]